MLRISKQPGHQGVITLEGRLVGPWVEELQRFVDQAPDKPGLAIDLRGLVFADDAGVNLLRALRDDGLRLIGGSGFVGALIGAEEADRGGSDVG
jgi:anti-anti-sigma regulatory factor